MSDLEKRKKEIILTLKKLGKTESQCSEIENKLNCEILNFTQGYISEKDALIEMNRMFEKSKYQHQESENEDFFECH